MHRERGLASPGLGGGNAAAMVMETMKNYQTRTAHPKRIPPPPDIEAGYDALIEYHQEYSMEELEEAGYLEDASPQHVREVAASATYQLLCHRGLNLKLSRKDYQQLSRLAAWEGVSTEDRVKKWIKQRLREARTRPTRDKQ
jgi:hypothetical protein